MSGCHDNVKRMLKQMILTIFSVTKEMFRIITFVDLFQINLQILNGIDNFVKPNALQTSIRSLYFVES